jgi:Na+-transporting NADH:ubiquinone oxidoreductase subunit A
VFQSLVIEIDDDVEARNWGASSAADAAQLSADDIKHRLIESGEWTAIRVRPFNKVADPATSPSGLFITAIDTRPHAVNPEIVIAEQREAFELGQALLANMVDCNVYVCVAPGSSAPVAAHAQVQSAAFSGPHPAGLAGTHVHFLQGASLNKLAWTVDFQDVIAIGRLFLDGEVYSDRVVAVSGPAAETPQIVRTRRGVDIEALVAGNQATG